MPKNEEIRERMFKQFRSLMKDEWNRKPLVDDNGLGVLPSAQGQKCRACVTRETKACCETDCELFRDLVFARQCGLAPRERTIVPEKEIEMKQDLLIDPCKFCKRSSQHLDLRVMQVVPITCTGTRSKKFTQAARRLGEEVSTY